MYIVLSYLICYNSFKEILTHKSVFSFVGFNTLLINKDKNIKLSCGKLYK